MIKKYTLLALQHAINRTLALDDATLSNIRCLSGKIVKIVIEPLGVHFFIHIQEERFILLSEVEVEADTIIHSSPIGLIRLSLLPASQVRTLFNDEIKISGDVELGQALKHIFDRFDLDWEGYLAQITGDVVAHQVGALVRQGMDFMKHAGMSMQQNLTEYLQEELAILPGKEEVADFFHDIDALSLTVERLAARIQKMLSAHEVH